MRWRGDQNARLVAHSQLVVLVASAEWSRLVDLEPRRAVVALFTCDDVALPVHGSARCVGGVRLLCRLRFIERAVGAPLSRAVVNPECRVTRSC